MATAQKTALALNSNNGKGKKLPDPILDRYDNEGILGAKPGMVKGERGKQITIEEAEIASKREEEQKKNEAAQELNRHVKYKFDGTLLYYEVLEMAKHRPLKWSGIATAASGVIGLAGYDVWKFGTPQNLPFIDTISMALKVGEFSMIVGVAFFTMLLCVEAIFLLDAYSLRSKRKSAQRVFDGIVNNTPIRRKDLMHIWHRNLGDDGIAHAAIEAFANAGHPRIDTVLGALKEQKFDKKVY